MEVKVVCPVHKVPMLHRFVTCVWECVGYDGEGCEWSITDEEVAREEERWEELKDV